MVKIEFPLPFKLPVKHNTKIGSVYKNEIFQVTFKHKKEKYRFEKDKEDKLYDITLALVEYILDDTIKDKINLDELFRFAVIGSIRYLNQFIDGLRHELNIRILDNFTIKDLPELIEINYGKKLYHYLTDPMEIIEDNIEANEEDIKKVLNTLSTWEEYPNIEVVDKFYDKAKYHLAKEEFIFAIIELQTSFEAFIRNVYYLILKKNKATNDKIEKAYNIPFRNLIEQKLAKELNVNLSFKESKQIKNWYDNLYLVRNKIVHSGTPYISGDIAYNAYDSYVSTRNYISQLLINKGYLTKNGNIDLKLFIKNSRGNIDENLLLKKMIKKGLASSNSKIIEK